MLLRTILNQQFENKFLSREIKKELIKELEEINKKETNNSFDEIDSTRKIVIKLEIGEIELNEARYWSQKAKNVWINLGY